MVAAPPQDDEGVRELMGKGHRGVFVNNGKGGRKAPKSRQAQVQKPPKKRRDRAGLGDKVMVQF